MQTGLVQPLSFTLLLFFLSLFLGKILQPACYSGCFQPKNVSKDQRLLAGSSIKLKNNNAPPLQKSERPRENSAKQTCCLSAKKFLTGSLWLSIGKPVDNFIPWFLHIWWKILHVIVRIAEKMSGLVSRSKECGYSLVVDFVFVPSETHPTDAYTRRKR